ncbi:hypothetical protein M408DRAFT_331180 [Serendipita vermifera MAFF 305830]|uniref:F-box domain-containing protein n=1 Tax=Serendipita vermifera MAFF 305830 TaxID=933852 RepID=A0A0C3AZL6_SERVB|nr:hypothetical protein M408DRAFT_331180 [Serendipita vermifera MAFF 305830]
MSAVTGFTSLPDELSFLILSFFHHPRPLLNVAAVNSHLYGLVEDDALWRALFVLYKHERTPYEEINNISFKHLFKNRFLLEQNWDHKLNATVLPFAAPDWVARPNLSSSQQRPIQSLIATGGQRAPVMAVSCAKSQVRVYDLKTQSLLSLIPEDDVRALALVLDVERERDEQPHLVGRRLPAGVSRGWGNKQLRLITGNKRIRVWKVPLRKGVNPLTIEVPSRIRCMRAVDGTPLLLTGSINGSVRLWDIAKGELVRELEGFHDGILCLDALKSSRSSEDGCEGPVIWAVGGSSDCTAKIWNLKTWQMKSLRGHQQAVHRVFIDEDIVVTGSIDSTVRTWRLETG